MPVEVVVTNKFYYGRTRTPAKEAIRRAPQLQLGDSYPNHLGIPFPSISSKVVNESGVQRKSVASILAEDIVVIRDWQRETGDRNWSQVAPGKILIGKEIETENICDGITEFRYTE